MKRDEQPMKIEKIHNFTRELLPIMLTDADGKYNGKFTMISEEHLTISQYLDKNTMHYKGNNITLSTLYQCIILPPPKPGHIYVVRKDLAQKLSLLRDDIYYPFHNYYVDKGSAYPTEEYGLVRMNVKISPDEKMEDSIRHLSEVHNLTNVDFAISQPRVGRYYPTSSVLIPHESPIKERHKYEGLEVAEFNGVNLILYSETISIDIPKPKHKENIYIVDLEVEPFVRRNDVYSPNHQLILGPTCPTDVITYCGFIRTDLMIMNK